MIQGPVANQAKSRTKEMQQREQEKYLHNGTVQLKRKIYFDK